jgi:hypothetical protein
MMKRNMLNASVGILLLASTKALAVSTTLVTLTYGTWTDLGAGPFLQLGAVGDVVFVIADTTPALTGGVGFKVIGTNTALATTSHIWATPTDPQVVGAKAIVAK